MTALVVSSLGTSSTEGGRVVRQTRIQSLLGVCWEDKVCGLRKVMSRIGQDETDAAFKPRSVFPVFSFLSIGNSPEFL